MFSLSISFDSDVMDALQDALDSAPKTTNTIINRAILPEFTERVKREVTPYPPARHGKVRWKSERQWKAYFATDGFGSGIPYVRSGRFGQAWELNYTELENGGQITISNNARTRTGDPLAQYIVGEHQQPFHADTGWPKADDKLATIQEDLTDAVIDVYFSIIDAPPGTRYI
jgi:hypothetical protein